MWSGVLGVLASPRGVEVECLREFEPGEIVVTCRLRQARFNGAREVGFPKKDTAQLALFDVE